MARICLTRLGKLCWLFLVASLTHLVDECIAVLGLRDFVVDVVVVVFVSVLLLVGSVGPPELK